MTKSRHLIQELLDPIVDRLVQHKDFLNRLQDEQTKSNGRIQELNDTFFNTGSKLQIFDVINDRLTGLDADRRLLEDKVDYQNKNLNQSLTQINERLTINQTIFENIQTHTKQVQEELI
jgi:chromosome condensin MukBEF MukE localization factor